MEDRSSFFGKIFEKIKREGKERGIVAKLVTCKKCDIQHIFRIVKGISGREGRERVIGRVCCFSDCRKSDVGLPQKFSICSQCLSVAYCSKRHQAADWARHKKECWNIHEQCQQAHATILSKFLQRIPPNVTVFNILPFLSFSPLKVSYGKEEGEAKGIREKNIFSCFGYFKHTRLPPNVRRIYFLYRSVSVSAIPQHGVVPIVDFAKVENLEIQKRAYINLGREGDIRQWNEVLRRDRLDLWILAGLKNVTLPSVRKIELIDTDVLRNRPYSTQRTAVKSNFGDLFVRICFPNLEKLVITNGIFSGIDPRSLRKLVYIRVTNITHKEEILSDTDDEEVQMREQMTIDFLSPETFSSTTNTSGDDKDNLPVLRSVWFYGVILKGEWATMPCLQRLSIHALQIIRGDNNNPSNSNSSRVRPFTLHDVLKNQTFANTKTIHFNEAEKFLGTLTMPSFRNVSKLTLLDIAKFPEALQHAAQTCDLSANAPWKLAGLRILLLHNCSNATDTIMGQITKCCVNLSELHIHKNQALTGDFVLSSPNLLEKIFLVKATSITDAFFQRNDFPKLRYLSLVRCPLVKGEEWNRMSNLKYFNYGDTPWDYTFFQQYSSLYYSFDDNNNNRRNRRRRHNRSDTCNCSRLLMHSMIMSSGATSLCDSFWEHPPFPSRGVVVDCLSEMPVPNTRNLFDVLRGRLETVRQRIYNAQIGGTGVYAEELPNHSTV